MDNKRIRYISTAGLIAALYMLLILPFFAISFGVVQIRFAEALTVLPYLTPAAIPGLYIGCLLANIIGGMGWLDIVFGSLVTLIAALVTRFIRNKLGDTTLAIALAPLPPVLLNAFGISLYLTPIWGVDYWVGVLRIGLGQFVACYVVGVPLLLLLKKRRIFV